MSSSPSPRIFVLYARADGVEPARKVRRQLEDAGLSLWQDLVALEGGRDWWSQIEEAIRAPSVEHLVLIVTQSVLERPVVRREVRLARQEGLQVTPVKGSDLIDLDALPRWSGHCTRSAQSGGAGTACHGPEGPQHAEARPFYGARSA